MFCQCYCLDIPGAVTFQTGILFFTHPRDLFKILYNLIMRCLRIIFSLESRRLIFYSAEDETGCLETSIKSHGLVNIIL